MISHTPYPPILIYECHGQRVPAVLRLHPGEFVKKTSARSQSHRTQNKRRPREVDRWGRCNGSWCRSQSSITIHRDPGWLDNWGTCHPRTWIHLRTRDTHPTMTSSNRSIFRVTDRFAGNSPVTGEFPAQRPVTRSFDVFFDQRRNKWSSKQWWGWWFETPSRPLWRHCNGMHVLQWFD